MLPFRVILEQKEIDRLTTHVPMVIAVVVIGGWMDKVDSP
jgi:hypothetical protein